MIKFVILRHGESVGNKGKVIQGHTGFYRLTEEGKEQIRRIGLENEVQLRDVDVAFSSDLERAVESLQCIIDNLQLTIPFYQTEMLREVNPGVLGGLSHVEADRQYPLYYGLWTKRGDLDGIPGAEEGSCLQARAMAFIQYVSDCYDDKTVLVVTHAAFMRSLINTLLARDRTTPICITSGFVHFVSNQSFLDHRELVFDGEHKTVYRYRDIAQQYAVKTITNPTKDLVDIYSYFVATPHPNVSRVYYEYVVDGRMYVVMRWADGTVLRGRLSDDEITRAWECVAELQETIEYNSFTVCVSLLDKIKYYQSIGSQVIKEIGDLLLVFSGEIERDNVPVLYDVHRDNFVFSNDGWTLIDVEGWLMAPVEFRASCFIAAFLLLEDATINMSHFSTMFKNNGWDENMTLKLIGCRLYIGLAYSSIYDSLPLKEKYKLAFCSWLDLVCDIKLIDNENVAMMRRLLSQV